MRDLPEPSANPTPLAWEQQPSLLHRIGWRADNLGQEILLGVVGFLAIAIMLGCILVGAGADLRETLARIVHYSGGERARFFGIGLAAALIEETVFRGLCQRWLVVRIGLAPGIVLTAVLFVFRHLNFHPIAMLGKLGIGLVLGILRGRDRPLIAPAIAHALIWIVLGAL